MAKGMVKEILLNGERVGEYESTGDIHDDIDLVKAFLKEKGLWKDIRVVDMMFGQAQAFAHTAIDLYRNGVLGTPRKPYAVAPFVVNSAFAIEVYLKTIHMLRGARVTGHSIKKLYHRIEVEIREQIATTAKEVAPQYELPTDADFDEYLDQLDDAFVQWRYLYEGNTGVISFEPTMFVMNVLDQVCIRLKETRVETPGS